MTVLSSEEATFPISHSKSSPFIFQEPVTLVAIFEELPPLWDVPEAEGADTELVEPEIGAAVDGVELTWEIGVGVPLSLIHI